MDSFDQLDATEDYSAFFSDDVLDILGGADWAFDVDLPEVSFPELDFPGFLDSSEDIVQDFNERSDSNCSSQLHFDLFSAGVPLTVENPVSSIPETSSSPITAFEQNLDKTNTHSGHTVQILIGDQDDKNESQKRKWKDSVVVFPVNPLTNPVPKRRKPFGPTERAEVALNRMIGACAQCKVRKGRVSQ